MQLTFGAPLLARYMQPAVTAFDGRVLLCLVHFLVRPVVNGSAIKTANYTHYYDKLTTHK